MQKGTAKDFDNLCGLDPLVKIFKDLIAFGTQADAVSQAVPSTVGQLRLGAYVLSLATDLGYVAYQDTNGVVTINIEASKGFEKAKALCLLAHMDTAPDCSGDNISPRLVKNYQGLGIELDNGLKLDGKMSDALKNHIGEDIIVTDGNTLLGADDKAGMSCLLHLLYNLKTNPSLTHGPLCIVFSVDEEIGKSTKYLDVKKLNCDYGITVDGTALGELDIATFNAYGAIVTFEGVSVHTAVAYKTLRNAITMANEFLSLLPRDEKPENTKDDEGFFHVHNIEGSTATCKINMIVRDFTNDGMKERLDLLEKTVQFMNTKYGSNFVQLKTMFQYANMEDVLLSNQEILDICKQSYADADVVCIENKVRGGTDGSNLSNQGLPTPNIFTGGLNCHGPYECLPVSSFNKAYKVLEAIVVNMSKTTKN